MKELSVFVDESGDFGSKSDSKYYIVAFVLHDQNEDITDLVRGMDAQLENTTHGIHPVHTMPLIRRESFYRIDTIQREFVGNRRDLKKNYLNKLEKKML